MQSPRSAIRFDDFAAHKSLGFQPVVDTTCRGTIERDGSRQPRLIETWICHIMVSAANWTDAKSIPAAVPSKPTRCDDLDCCTAVEPAEGMLPYWS